MSVITACDICNHRRKIPESKLGDELKCSVCSAKFIAKEAPEVDEVERDPNEPSEFWKTMQIMWHGVTGVLVLGMLALMISLVGSDPRKTSARSTTSSRNTSSQFASTNPGDRPPSRSTGSPNSTTNGYRFPPGTPNVTQRSRTTTDLSTTTTKQNSPRETAEDAPFETEGFQFSDDEDSAEMSADVESSIGTNAANKRANESGSAPDIRDSRGQKVTYDGPRNIPSSGRTVTSIKQLRVGQIIQVKWGSNWYPCDVLQISSSKVKIHYRGWSDGFDEEVTLDRIQLAHEGIDDGSK